MKPRRIIIVALLLGVFLNVNAQDKPLETIEIKNGSIHMTGDFDYTKFLKKYKGTSRLSIHVWYNASGSSVSKKDIKAKDDEVYFLYGRNHQSGQTEMTFVFGANAKKAFTKKKEEEYTEFIDFFEFEVFPNSHFSGAKAMEELMKVFEKK